MKFKNKFLGGAFALSVGAFISKVIGCIYRIPLTNIIGAEALGLYQMIFPLYCIILTFSSTGVPNSLAKLISEGNSAKGVLRSSLKIFIPLGIIGSLIMATLGYPIAYLQGNYKAGLGYIMLSPSILLVSILSCFRGYFQGKSNMNPTAISQVIEQVVKLMVGLTLGYIYKVKPILSSATCALAVTFSEVVALIYIYLKYKKNPSQEQRVFFSRSKIFKTVLPVTLSSLLLPIAKIADSFLILNILKGYMADYTQVYGIYSGGVESIIGVPVALCYGFAITSIPFIAKSKTQGQNRVKNNCKKVTLYTLFFGIIFAVMLFLGAKIVVNLLYFSLNLKYKTLMIKLIRVLSITIVSLSLVQTTSAILVSLGKLYTPCLTLGISVLIKIVLSLIFLANPKLNIFASAISDIVCFSFACLLNLIFIFSKKSNLSSNFY